MRPLRPLELPLSGVQLIEASAGTGKTYTITTLVLRLLLERGLNIQQIVVVTFTKAATAELRSRVRQRLRRALDAVTNGHEAMDDPVLEHLCRSSTPKQVRRRLTEALQSMDEASIVTIHGFCQRVLLEFAFESKLRFDSELLLDQRPLILEIVQDFWALEVACLSEAEVRFLESAGVNLQDLTSLAATAITWLDTPLVTHDAQTDTRPHLERYLMARSQAASIYKQHGSEIRSLLENSLALNRRSYKRDTFARWFEELETLFETDSESLDAYSEAVHRLCRSTLEKATNSGKQTPRHPFFETCEWLEQAHTAALLAFEHWLVQFKLKLALYARAEARQRKLERGLLSFDDLLSNMASALSGPRGETLAKLVREKYPAALIDEFQDTDPIQYQVFSRIFGKANSTLFLIGDPKQAIYGFRGADIFAYLKAVADAGQNTWTLDTNYRSDKSLVAALNCFFGRPYQPFLLDGISYVKVEPRPCAGDALAEPNSQSASLEVLFVERARTGAKQNMIAKRWADQCLPDWVAADIARLLASDTTLHGKPIKPSDIAVLTRTNVQAAQVGQALGELQIPSALVGDSSVFDSPEAGEMRQILRAMAEPTSAGALKSALCTPSLGVSLRELAELSSDESAWEHWVELFRNLNGLWERRGFVHAMQALFRQRQVSARTLMLANGERRLTNLRHLTELLHQAETELHLGIAGLVLWFDDVRFNPSAREGMAPEAQQLRLESDEHAVQLTTMHKSKGLEYPIVYCPYLWRDASLFPQEIKHLRVHDSKHDHQLKIDLRTPADKQTSLLEASREALAESLRLAYVAMTRAKHRTVLVWGAFKNAEDSSLGYLLYQPAEPLGALSEMARPRIHTMSDGQLKAALERYEELAPGAFSVRSLEPTPRPPYNEHQPATDSFRVRTLTRQIDTSLRLSSFSQLASRAHKLSVVASVGKDVDEAMERDVVVETDLPGELGEVPLNAFPRGARAGELLHSILENIDFQDPAALAECTRIELERHGLEPEEWLDVVVEALRGVLDTELPGETGLTLSSISRARRVCEMEFTMPVRNQPPHVNPSALVHPRDLARVFDEHAPELSETYKKRLASLDFAPLRGFLRGFIDLVFEHDGRYFVVDYKSNHLGAQPSAYLPAELVAPMEEHHYHLQYHLYVVALDRYLKARLANYDYERHFGGVYYLFLRGMVPSYAKGSGVFQARPSATLTQKLLSLFHRQDET